MELDPSFFPSSGNPTNTRHWLNMKGTYQTFFAQHWCGAGALNILWCLRAEEGSLPIKDVWILMDKLPGRAADGCHVTGQRAVTFTASRFVRALCFFLTGKVTALALWTQLVWWWRCVAVVLLLDFASKHIPLGPGYAVESFSANLWASCRSVCLKS